MAGFCQDFCLWPCHLPPAHPPQTQALSTTSLYKLQDQDEGSIEAKMLAPKGGVPGRAGGIGKQAQLCLLWPCKHNSMPKNRKQFQQLSEKQHWWEGWACNGISICSRLGDMFSQFKILPKSPCASTATAFLALKAPFSWQKLHIHGKKGADTPVQRKSTSKAGLKICPIRQTSQLQVRLLLLSGTAGNAWSCHSV